MVSPLAAASQLYGIDTASPPSDDRKGKSGSLLTAILLSSGRDGCACKCCRYAGQLADILLEDVDSPFPQPSAAPIPPSRTPPAAATPTAPSVAAPSAAATPQTIEVSTEAAGV